MKTRVLAGLVLVPVLGLAACQGTTATTTAPAPATTTSAPAVTQTATQTATQATTATQTATTTQTATAQASSSAPASSSATAAQLKQQCLGDSGVCFSYNPSLTIQDASRQNVTGYKVIREQLQILTISAQSGPLGGGCQNDQSAQDDSEVVSFTPLAMGQLLPEPRHGEQAGVVEAVIGDSKQGYRPVVFAGNGAKVTKPGKVTSCDATPQEGFALAPGGLRIIANTETGNAPQPKTYPTAAEAKQALQERQFQAAKEILATMTRG